MKKKDWTILMYLNGTNELAPEMQHTFNSIDNSKVSENHNILVEIGKSSSKLVSSFRPNTSYSLDNWTGVRRYLIRRNDNKLIMDLGNLNMTHYKNLYDFLDWGIRNFPAKRYSVIISGHGFFTLCLSDLYGKSPYSMGIYELCYVINSIQKNLNINFDIIILDICSMNNIEIIYELSKNKSPQYLLTYYEEGPLCGMPIIEILSSLDNRKVEDILKEIVSKINLNLIAIELNPSAMKQVKSLSNTLGKKFLTHKAENTNIDLSILSDLKKEINNLMINKLTVFSKDKINNNLSNIITNELYNNTNNALFLKLYAKLSFNHNNYWFNVISNKSINEALLKNSSKLSVEELTKQHIYTLISFYNADLTKKEIESITNSLYEKYYNNKI